MEQALEEAGLDPIVDLATARKHADNGDGTLELGEPFFAIALVDGGGGSVFALYLDSSGDIAEDLWFESSPDALSFYDELDWLRPPSSSPAN